MGGGLGDEGGAVEVEVEGDELYAVVGDGRVDWEVED